jgi:hypothetical protein
MSGRGVNSVALGAAAMTTLDARIPSRAVVTLYHLRRETERERGWAVLGRTADT